MNRLHLILVAVLDTAREGGLHQDHADAVFTALSGILADVPAEAVTLFEENVKRILDAELP